MLFILQAGKAQTVTMYGFLDTTQLVYVNTDKKGYATAERKELLPPGVTQSLAALHTRG